MNQLEKITKLIIFIGVPFIFVLAVYFAEPSSWLTLGQGMIGKGEGFWFLAPGMAIATFLGAFAYSGAGGNLNLTQSIYVKEKGYGMGAYSQKIAGLFAAKGAKQEVKLEGEEFEHNEENIKRFKNWWRRVNLEHLLVFWAIGLLSMSMLMFLAYNTVYGLAGNGEGINFVIHEGLQIGALTSPYLGIFFLVVVGIMLFQTQLGIMDSTSRIMSENAAIEKLRRSGDKKVALSKIYYIFVWAQIAFGISLFLFNFYEPKSLIVLGAVINAFAMLVHTILVTILNRRSLAKVFQPKLWRKIIIYIIIAFFAVFSAIVFKAQLF